MTQTRSGDIVPNQKYIYMYSIFPKLGVGGGIVFLIIYKYNRGEKPKPKPERGSRGGQIFAADPVEDWKRERVRFEYKTVEK